MSASLNLAKSERCENLVTTLLQLGPSDKKPKYVLGNLIFCLKNKHSAAFLSERVRSSRSSNFEMIIRRQDNNQSIQTLLRGKQTLNSPSHLKRELSAYSLRLFS